MKPALLSFILFLSFVAFSQKGRGGHYEITGYLRGLDEDSIQVLINYYSLDGKWQKTDTLATTAAAGHFSLQGTVQKPKLVWAKFGKGRSTHNMSIFVEEGKIQMLGSIDSLERSRVTGTPSNDDLWQVRKSTNEIYDRISLLRSSMNGVQEGSARYKELSSIIAAKYDSVDKIEIDFIKSHPHSFASSVFLYVKQDKLPVEQLEQLFDHLDPDVRTSDLVLLIPQKISARKSVAPGNHAPLFASFDTSGKKINLSDFRGQYVLLEFWASWCVPCRKQSPHLASLYKKYHDKGFTIVQYSIDEKQAEKKWKQAIVTDGLNWTQLSDLAGFESPVPKIYGVQPIPDNFLIDPNGVIIARGLQGQELETKLSQLLNK